MKLKIFITIEFSIRLLVFLFLEVIFDFNFEQLNFNCLNFIKFTQLLFIIRNQLFPLFFVILNISMMSSKFRNYLRHNLERWLNNISNKLLLSFTYIDFISITKITNRDIQFSFFISLLKLKKLLNWKIQS